MTNLTANSALELQIPTPGGFQFNFATICFEDFLKAPKVHPLAKQNLISFVKFVEGLAVPADRLFPEELRASLIQNYPVSEAPQGMVKIEAINKAFQTFLGLLKTGKIHLIFAQTLGEEIMVSAKPELLAQVHDQGNPEAEIILLLPETFQHRAVKDNVNLLRQLVTEGMLVSFALSGKKTRQHPVAIEAKYNQLIRRCAGEVMYLCWTRAKVEQFSRYPAEDIVYFLFSRASQPVRRAIARTLARLDKEAARQYQAKASLAMLGMLIELHRKKAKPTRAALLSTAATVTAINEYDRAVFQAAIDFLNFPV